MRRRPGVALLAVMLFCFAAALVGTETFLLLKLSTVLHICVHRCGRMTSVCFPSFHRGRRTCGKLFEELGRLPPSYPQPVIHSPLSTVGCPQLLARRLAVGHSQRLRAVGSLRAVTAPTAAG